MKNSFTASVLASSWSFALRMTFFYGLFILLVSSLYSCVPEKENPKPVKDVKDVDGNSYSFVEIGTQTWMAENLRTSRYSNGDPIPYVVDTTAWSTLSTGAYCYYDDIERNNEDYGKLYNWFAARDTRNVCPTGWHVPTGLEWTKLAEFLGEGSGGKLKGGYWFPPNADATNENGFTGLPGGMRYFEGWYYYFGSMAYWWCNTEIDPATAWNINIINVNSNISLNNHDKRNGYSIRCIKD